MTDTSNTELTQGTDFTVTDKVVTLANPTNLKVQIYRRTDTKPLVGWADASVLKAADMTVQSTQLLHLAEESLDMAQEKGLTVDDKDGIWDARYNKIKNLLEPTEAGDAVNLGYITKNQDSLLNKLNSTGATQNKSIVATGDAQNARLIATGEAQNTRLLNTGDNKNKTLEDTGDAQNERLITTGNEQNTRLTVTGTYQNKIVTDTGRNYVSTMTTLKDTVVNKANEVNSSADLAKKWAEAEDSPNGEYGSKSSLGWAREAKASANASASSATTSASSAKSAKESDDNASVHAHSASSSATEAASSATAAAKSATEAATSLTQLGNHEANAAKSAKAAADSAALAKMHADNASKYDAVNSLKAEEELGDSSMPVVNIPLKRGMFLLTGYPDGFDTTDGKYPYALIVNLKSSYGGILSLYIQDKHKEIYYRVGWEDIWRTEWIKFTIPEDLDTFKINLKKDNDLLRDYLHRFGDNAELPTEDDSLNALGVFSNSYNGANNFTYQPTTYGQLINIPYGKGRISTQLWLDYTGKLFYRGASVKENIKDISFTRFLDENDNRNILAAIPKKLSQLSNDANYATTTDVATAVEKSATTIKAQIPKATSQLTNDSGYATTESVDNKIDAVWDTPLDWGTLESNIILQGTSIAYDANNIPTRYRLGFLADIIKTNIETTLQDYALKAAIPTKTSQLTNDSGFAVINSSGHLVINGSELWIE